MRYFVLFTLYLMVKLNRFCGKAKARCRIYLGAGTTQRREVKRKGKCWGKDGGRVSGRGRKGMSVLGFTGGWQAAVNVARELCIMQLKTVS